MNKRHGESMLRVAFIFSCIEFDYNEDVTNSGLINAPYSVAIRVDKDLMFFLWHCSSILASVCSSLYLYADDYSDFSDDLILQPFLWWLGLFSKLLCLFLDKLES